MRQFANGSGAQFDDLWSRLCAAPKKIRYGVTLKPSIFATLIFSSSGEAVTTSLTVDSGNAADYAGESAFVRELLGGGSVTFSSPEDMRRRFSEVRADYTSDAPNNPPRLKFRGAKIDCEKLSAALKAKIIGQDERIDGIARAVCNHLRKKNPKKPLTLMLTGTTGVGKSATARALAEELQGLVGKDAMPLITVNCNEFKEEYRISQLLGSPAGYVGYNDPCMLEPMKKTDAGIILFDEFEKAHPSIHTAVMGWLDSGKIIFSHIDAGQTSAEYDCAASIIIMTSNIDMTTPDRKRVSCASAFDMNDECRQIMVGKGFKPEIAGRISRFFEFAPLSESDVKKVLALKFRNKAEEYGAKINAISDGLLDDIYSKTGASAFGVRPLEYALDDALGRQIPDIPASGAKSFDVGGTIDDMRFTEV